MLYHPTLPFFHQFEKKMLISFATFCSFSPKTYVRKYSRLLLNTPLDICCIIFLNKNKKLKHEPKSLLLEKQRFHALLKKTVTNKYMKKKHVQKSFHFSLIQNMHIWKTRFNGTPSPTPDKHYPFILSWANFVHALFLYLPRLSNGSPLHWVQNYLWPN